MFVERVGVIVVWPDLTHAPSTGADDMNNTIGT
jgi:hypothetical protein